MTPLPWIFDDGGRAAAGFRGHADDCACRAIAIAADMGYQQAYNLLNELGRTERPRRRRDGTVRERSSARTGVWRASADKALGALGWGWHPTMAIGSGCRVHMAIGELPGGILIARLSGHYSAIVRGIVHDTYDPSRGGTRCVYGYWAPLVNHGQ